MRNRLLCTLLATMALGGCSSSGTPADMGTDGKKGPPMCKPDGQTVMLAPEYGVLADLTVTVMVTPGCSGASCIVNQDADAKLLLLASISQSGTSATVTAQPCKIDIPKVPLKGNNLPVILTAPDALVSSVKAVTSSATLDSTMTCAHFDAQPINLALGANLANPGTDPLPAYGSGMTTKYCGGMVTTPCLTNTTPAPSDTGCVCDQDMDGKPGATLGAMNAPGFDDLDKIYADFRTSVTLTGQVFPQASGQATPGPRIEGTVTNLKLDQNVLGCHHNPSGGAAPYDCTDSDTAVVAGFNPAITQSANTPSTFLAVPVAGSTTCAQLISQEATLFQ